MNSKKIEFSQEQYLQLMQMVYLGQWMATSHLDEPDATFSEIEQYVYSQAKNYALTEWVDYNPDEKKYFPSTMMEEEMEPVIQEYDDYTFWDELAWQMAERDFEQKFDQSQILCMTNEEIFAEKSALSDRYYEEFTTNGVGNLVLAK